MAKKKAKKKSKGGKRKMSPAQKAALAKGRAVMAAKRAGKPAKAKKAGGGKKKKSKAKKATAVLAMVVHKTKGVAKKATGKVRSMKAGKMLKNPIVLKVMEAPVVGLSAWGSAKALSYLPVKNPVAKAGAQAILGAILSMAMGKMHPLVEKAGDGMYHAGIFGLQKAAFGAESMAGEEDYSFAMMGEDVVQVTPAELAAMQGEDEDSIAGASESFAGTSESFAGTGGSREWRVAT